MSDDAKPAYLRGRGSRGRGIPAAGDRNIQRRQKKEWTNHGASTTESRLPQDSATNANYVGGNSARNIVTSAKLQHHMWRLVTGLLALVLYWMD